MKMKTATVLWWFFNDSEGNKLSTTVYNFSGNIFGCIDFMSQVQKVIHKQYLVAFKVAFTYSYIVLLAAGKIYF